MNTDERRLAQPMKPMSAARLRAEAAFAAIDTAHVPAQQTQAVVMQSRFSPEVTEALAPTPGNAPEAGTKAPRIFRIDAVTTEPQAPALPAETLPPKPDAGVHVGRRRRAPERRPGQVVHILAAGQPRVTPDPPLATLHDHLEPVGRLLDEAGHAQAFTINEHHPEADWQALALRADQLGRELHQLLR